MSVGFLACIQLGVCMCEHILSWCVCVIDRDVAASLLDDVMKAVFSRILVGFLSMDSF